MRMAKYQDKEFLTREYVENRKSAHEIADMCGVAPNTITYWLDKHDIEIRDPVQESKRKRRVEWAYFGTNDAGHEYWKTSDSQGGGDIMYVHRLQKIAENGVEEVKDKEVHHKNGIPWDNRPENLQIMSQSDHRSHHASGVDDWEKKDTPWRDKERLERMYHGEEMTPPEIADELGCTPPTILRWLENHDIPKRSRSETARLVKVWENAQ